MDNAQNFEEKWARLLQAAKVNSDSALARVLEILPQSVTAARKRRQIPGGWVETLAQKCAVSSDWLFFGAGEAAPSEKAKTETEPSTVDGPDHQIIMIPMVEARLSAGNGSFETDGSSERKYSFRSDFLLRKGKIKDMVLMRVDGDSMSPQIEDGDVVLIDQSQDAPRAGGIFAVGVEDLVYLKKVNTAPGKLILSSYNPAYSPFEIDTRGDLESQVRIIGRVIWSCREW